MTEYLHEIASKMKEYERNDDFETDANGMLVLARLDGHCFSTFTKGLARPFDRRLAAAMRRTSSDLLAEYHATTAYSHSDEITLIFMPNLDEEGKPRDWPFGGRVHKLNSLLAATASVRFNH